LSTERLLAHPLGDSAVTISFGTERSTALLQRIQTAARSIESAGIPVIREVVPAYLALTVFYDSLSTTYQEIAEQLLALSGKMPAPDKRPAKSRDHVIPVRYDGMDLEAVAAATNLTASQVISIHSGRSYTVDLLGFVPGYAYMSELDPRLHLPRRPEPRPRVPAGSVAIAAAQTGIYPLETPGGWHIIGTTAAVMFDPARDPPALLAAGDVVRFEVLT